MIDPIVEQTFLNEAERAKYQELLTQLGADQAKIAWLTAKAIIKNKHDFVHFCRRTLGYAQMLLDHDRLCQWMQAHPDSPKLILMPRGSFKSSLATIGYTLWKLLNNPNLKVLIYSDTTEKAERFLLSIKNHILGLEGHAGFRQLTHQQPWEVNPQEKTWNQSAIVISPRTQGHFVPSVDVAGIETSKAGMHYDLIIFDDIVTDRNITTIDQMDKVENCYRDALSLLMPGGEVVMLGTRWHFGELYGRLLAQDGQTHRWQTFIRDAEVSPTGAPFPYADIGLSEAFLMRQKAAQGTKKYSCLYRMSPQDDETATFKVKDFRFYQPAQTDAFKQWLGTLYVTCVLDAIPPPTQDHGDDAAITVVGTDAEHAMFLLDAVSDRMSPDQQIEEVLAMHAHWRFRKFGLETNAFQRMIKSTLDLKLRELRTKPVYHPFEIVEFSGITQGNKERRIEGLQPWHEQGLLRFPGTSVETLTGVWKKLAYQMIEFPHGQHDDALDSLAYHLQLKQPGFVTPVVVDLPYTSAAWFEREQRKEELVELARRPRWRRRPLPELAFS